MDHNDICTAYQACKYFPQYQLLILQNYVGGSYEVFTSFGLIQVCTKKPILYNVFKTFQSPNMVTEQSAKNNSWYWENILMLRVDKYLFWPRYNLQFRSYGTPGIFSQMGFLTIWTSKLHKWNYTHYPRLLQYVPIFFFAAVEQRQFLYSSIHIYCKVYTLKIDLRAEDR